MSGASLSQRRSRLGAERQWHNLRDSLSPTSFDVRCLLRLEPERSDTEFEMRTIMSILTCLVRLTRRKRSSVFFDTI